VNAYAIDGYLKKNIIANPSCSTAQMVVAFQTYDDDQARRRHRFLPVGLRRGQEEHGRAVRDDRATSSSAIRPRSSQADRVQRHPHCGDFLDDGSTTRKWKLVVETKKSSIRRSKVRRPASRVPVFVGLPRRSTSKFGKSPPPGSAAHPAQAPVSCSSI
jgi:aspartate-semialdehyde dehydrogenase